MDENNEKQKEITLRKQCFSEVKSMVEKEVIQDGDYRDTQIVRKIWQNAAKTGT